MTDGRAVVVTGSSGGIGRATVSVFRESGWTTVGLDREEPPDGAAPDHFLRTHVGDRRQVEKAFSEVERRIGALDGLVNNAAVQRSAPFSEFSSAAWDETLDTNLRGTYLCVQRALPLLGEGEGGAVVNVSSVHACATSPGLSAYAASKGGVLALTRALALELAERGIRVNAVLPGAVDTEMLREGLGRGHLPGDDVAERVRELGDRHALGRVGRPEEIARAIRFLADDRLSSFVTGESLAVDGGALARLSTE